MAKKTVVVAGASREESEGARVVVRSVEGWIVWWIEGAGVGVEREKRAGEAGGRWAE
jgi:hypothetical protein